MTARPPTHGCVIVATGAAPLASEAVAALPGDAFVVAADGGLDHARAAGLRPDVLIGDLDSVSAEGLAWAEEHAAVVRHPADKADTDTELALDYAAALGAEQLILVAGAGDRFDHAIAALGALGAETVEQIPVVQAWWGADQVHIVRPRRPVSLALAPGTTFSVLATRGRCRGVTITGARWPLHDADLAPLAGSGVSNEATGASVDIHVHDGTLTVVIPGAQP